MVRDVNQDGEFAEEELFFYGKDHLNSVYTLTDKSGKPVQRYSYTAYGETKVEKTNPSNKLIKNFYAYTSREWEEETGRFLALDPIGFSGGDTNLYRFVGNNPIMYNDPSGLKYRSCKRKLDGSPGMAGRFYHEYIDFDSGSDYSFAPADGEGLFNSISQNKRENPENDSCGEWSKDSSNDQAIRDRAKQNMTREYNLKSYNCQDFVGDTLNGF